MSAIEIVAIVLIVAGILALIYGKFSFTSTHDTKLGPLAVSVDEKQNKQSTSRYGLALGR